MNWRGILSRDCISGEESETEAEREEEQDRGTDRKHKGVRVKRRQTAFLPPVVITSFLTRRLLVGVDTQACQIMTVNT